MDFRLKIASNTWKNAPHFSDADAAAGPSH